MKNRLEKVELSIKIMNAIFMTIILISLISCSHSTPAPQPVKVDCVGAWSACQGPCGIWGAKQIYHVEVAAQNGGMACENVEGAVKVCTASVCPVANGVWCMTGGGFSPCAPHNPLIDQACTVGQSLESDCKMYSCLASCPTAAKSLKLKK